MIITTITTITIITTSTDIIITGGWQATALFLFGFLLSSLDYFSVLSWWMMMMMMIMRRCEKVMVNSIDGISVILYHTTAILTFNQVLMVYWASTLSLLPSSVKIHFLQRK